MDCYTCYDAELRLYDYLDQELSPGEAAAVREHLAVCRPCFDSFQFEQQVVAIVREKCRISCDTRRLWRRIVRQIERT